MNPLPEYLEGVPNVSGHEAEVGQTLAAGAVKTLFRDRGGIDFGRIRAATAIALHMHQPLIPAGGGDLRTATLIGNLQHMMEHPGIGDNHNASVFAWCYKRMGEFIPQLIDEGKSPRVMLEYSGTLLHGLRQMGRDDVIDALKGITWRRLPGSRPCAGHVRCGNGRSGSRLHRCRDRMSVDRLVDVVSLLKFPARSVEQRFSYDALAALAKASKASYGSLVDEDSAMRHDAVWSCRTRIAQDISMMPVDVIRYVGGTRQDVTPQPQIIATPSVWVDSIDWRYQVVDSWLGWGNAWGLVTEATAAGYPARIELLAPSAVSPSAGSAPGKFMVTGHGEEELWPVGRLWHVPAFTPPGSILGLSPIGLHAATISTGIAAGTYGKGFFDGGGHLSPHPRLQSGHPPSAQPYRRRCHGRYRRALGGGARGPLAPGR